MGGEAKDIKEFLYAFLMKRYRIPPIYDIKPIGDNRGFYCELRVQGIDHIGFGKSVSKKDAQGEAASEFVRYLVCQGSLRPEQVPAIFNLGQRNGRSYPPNNSGPSSSGFSNRSSGYHSLNDSGRKSGNGTAVGRISTDSSKIDGGWNVENAKAKLHPMLQEQGISVEYRYTSCGPHHQPSFAAEKRFYVRQLGREIYARETGLNKATASKACALSLVRQLYHAKVIGPFSTTKKNSSETTPFAVVLLPELEDDLDRIIYDLSLRPMRVDDYGLQTLLDDRLAPRSMHMNSDNGRSGIVDIPWSPPAPNWNPWTASKIDRGYYVTATLDEISQELWQRQENRLKTDSGLKKALEERKSLPIHAFKNKLMEVLYNNNVVVIRGSTGSGKTTQVCQYILDEALKWKEGAAHRSIIVTQPRRISAISCAERVASERREEIGDSVGYSVRFENCLPRPYGSILFCTVGVLLRRLERGLHGVSHVIVDEVHERDAQTDFLLILLRDLLNRYPGRLNVILMSATIDTSLFSRYFGSCPVVDIPGRAYPVDTFYLEDCIEVLRFRPPLAPTIKSNTQRSSKDDDYEYEDNLNLKVSDKYSSETRRAMSMLNEKDICPELVEHLLSHIIQMNVSGAVLIFLPGWSTISALMRHLQRSRLLNGQCHFLPLHSMIPREDQRRVFQPAPEGRLKVILSTNIAESSITIDDVVFVIDACLANVKLFTSHNNMHNYATVWAAKDNLEQRRGRAGRVRAGYAFRLCSHARYQRLEDSLKAEILRTPLHQSALAIKLLRLGSIAQFLGRAMEPPPVNAVVQAEVMLREMKCLDSREELTPLGKLVARLPVEPALAKMMIVGALLGHGDAACILAAADSLDSDIFYLGPDCNRLSESQRSFGGRRYSDHVAQLSAFYAYEQNRIEHGTKNLYTFCDNNGLSYSSLRTLYDARNQLRDMMLNFGFPKSSLTPKVYKTTGTDAGLDVVIGLIPMGHHPNVCVHKEKRKVLLVDGNKGGGAIHKTSINCPTGLGDDVQFPLPFFVFGQKIRSQQVICKNLTLVTPLHLLLFGCKLVQVVSDGGTFIRLDGWINLQMDPQTVANLLSIRPALDQLILRVSDEPERATEYARHPLVQLITRLCYSQAAEYPQAPGLPGYNKRPSDDGGYDYEAEKCGRYEQTRAPLPNYSVSSGPASSASNSSNRQYQSHLQQPTNHTQSSSWRGEHHQSDRRGGTAAGQQRGVNGNWRNSVR